MMSDLDMLASINKLLGSNYKTIDSVPHTELHRLWLILKLRELMEQNNNIRIFVCNPLDEEG